MSGCRRCRRFIGAPRQLLENAAATLVGTGAQLPQSVQLFLQRAQIIDPVSHVLDVFIEQ